MKKVAEVNRVEAGIWEVIDTRSNKVVKRNLPNGAKAAAYAEYYSEEVEKAEEQWSK